jgi:hypothetical protein
MDVNMPRSLSAVESGFKGIDSPLHPGFVLSDKLAGRAAHTGVRALGNLGEVRHCESEEHRILQAVKENPHALAVVLATVSVAEDAETMVTADGNGHGSSVATVGPEADPLLLTV